MAFPKCYPVCVCAYRSCLSQFCLCNSSYHCAMDRSAVCMQAGMQTLHVSCKPLSRRGVLPHHTFSASTSDIDLA